MSIVIVMKDLPEVKHEEPCSPPRRQYPVRPAPWRGETDIRSKSLRLRKVWEQIEKEAHNEQDI